MHPHATLMHRSSSCQSNALWALLAKCLPCKRFYMDLCVMMTQAALRGTGFKDMGIMGSTAAVRYKGTTQHNVPALKQRRGATCKRESRQAFAEIAS